MTWILDYPDADTWGATALPEARPGMLHRARAQALVRFVFGEDPVAGGAALRRLAAAFGALLDTASLPKDDDAARALWQRLRVERSATSQAAGEGAGEAPPRAADRNAEPPDEWNPWEPLFAIALQALCQCLAEGGRTDDDAPPADEDDLADDEAEEFDEDAQDTPAPGNFAMHCREHEVVTAVQRAILRRLDGAGMAEAARRCAALVVAALLENLPASLQLRRAQVRTTAADGRSITPWCLASSNPEIAERLRELERTLPLRLTLQPARKAPRYVEADGGGPGELVRYRLTNDFLRAFHAAHPAGRRYVEAVNAQQAVAWRVNLDVLEIALALAAVAHSPRHWPDRANALVSRSGIDAATLAGLKEWVRTAFYRPQKSASKTRRAYLRPGEFVDHALARNALNELATADDSGSQPAFFLAWMADYRGRIYPRTAWLNPQGADLQRALFEFAQGSPLSGDAAAGALKRHGAARVKRDRILRDLGIRDREVITADEAERWIAMHEKDILASAESPLNEAFWREAAEDEPLQFLAFCLAYRRWRADPGADVHLPIQIDGTCNGLQHIAALCRDRRLAQAVNVLPRGDGLPGDVYSEVASAARPKADARRCDTAWRSPPGRSAGERALERALVLAARPMIDPAWLDRSTAKKVIMTIPYGASIGSQSIEMLTALGKRLDSALRMEDEALRALGAQVVALKRDSALGGFLRRARVVLGRAFRDVRPETSRLAGLYDTARQAARAGQAGPSHAELAWRGAVAVAAVVAREIVGCVRECVDELYPSVPGFARFLEGGSAACRAMPLAWISPEGFAVCQDKFERQNSSLRGRLGRKAVDVGVTRLKERVAPLEQRRALLPNLIHSLDASHLARAIRAATLKGIARFGSIHDCMLCHPNDADAFAEILRDTFATLYSGSDVPNVLARWVDWIEVIAQIAGTDNARRVLGALAHPESDEAKELAKDREGPLGQLVARIRTWNEEHRALAAQLLAYRVDPDRYRELVAKARKAAAIGAFPIAADPAFDIAGVRKARYFFS